MDGAIRSAVDEILRMLAGRDYAGIESATGGRRLPAVEIARAVEEYGRIITLPPPGTPPGTEDPLDVVEVTGTHPRRWSVTAPVWTIEEGRSDLTLELTVIEGDAGVLAVELDDLHVL